MNEGRWNIKTEEIIDIYESYVMKKKRNHPGQNFPEVLELKVENGDISHFKKFQFWEARGAEVILRFYNLQTLRLSHFYFSDFVGDCRCDYKECYAPTWLCKNRMLLRLMKRVPHIIFEDCVFESHFLDQLFKLQCTAFGPTSSPLGCTSRGFRKEPPSITFQRCEFFKFVLPIDFKKSFKTFIFQDCWDQATKVRLNQRGQFLSQRDVWIRLVFFHLHHQPFGFLLKLNLCKRPWLKGPT
jgi:hypothetical protein